MLQRAASNAYSWWWASHVRTNQSRWLDNDLQEMEDRIKSMVKVIEEDGDTFAKKAELYFQKRPELLTYVEETYRSYRGLADRYDHVSRELHKANHTIAQAFPDQVQLAMQEDNETDRGGYPKAITIDASAKPINPPIEILKLAGPGDPLHKKPRHKRIASHINKDKAREEIDRLQKEILGLQTEKEFVKSTYESSIAKYWDIESQINDLQEEVTSLQDMFSTSAVIEDDEARALMAARAIKSCEGTLVNLQQLQLKSSQEAKLESRRIREAKRKIRFLKGECDELEIYKEDEEEEKVDEIKSGLKEATMELQVICQKVRDHFAKGSEASVVELAERIDELVEKVISLELTVSSQGAQIQRLRTDTDELQKYLKNLEEDNKGVISEDTNQFQEDLKKAEEDLQRIEQLERNLKDEKGIIQTHFNEACNSFANLSDQLNSPKGKTVISEFGDSYSTVTDVETVVDSTVLQLLIGMEGKDGKSVLDILRNFKDTRKLVLEIDRKNQELNSETMAQVRELKSANQMKDEEIQSLRKTLSLIQANFNNNSNNISSSSNNNNGQNLGEMLNLQNIEGIMEMCEIEQNHVNSEMESKLRGDIDTLLEENLDFWLRFSTSYHQIQDFQSQFEELRAETDKIKDLSSEFSIGNEESTPVEKRLRELNTDLQVWLEKNLILKSELENRSDSLNKLKDEISKISKELDSTQFTPYQNAKFQGEISNMQQENNKVAKELKTGLDHVRNLQVEIGKELLKLRQSFEIANSSRSSGSYSNLHHHFRNLSTKARIPLRTFLFGTKPKKPSLFNCMNPALQKQYSDLRAQPGFHT